MFTVNEHREKRLDGRSRGQTIMFSGNPKLINALKDTVSNRFETLCRSTRLSIVLFAHSDVLLIPYLLFGSCLLDRPFVLLNLGVVRR